jgi:hypothetical protein
VGKTNTWLNRVGSNDVGKLHAPNTAGVLFRLIKISTQDTGHTCEPDTGFSSPMLSHASHVLATAIIQCTPLPQLQYQGEPLPGKDRRNVVDPVAVE